MVQIDDLVARLDAKDFAARQAAERELLRMGLPAIGSRLKESVRSRKLSAEASALVNNLLDVVDRIDRLIRRLNIESPPPVTMFGIMDPSSVSDDAVDADEARLRLMRIGPIALPQIKAAIEWQKLSPQGAKRANAVIANLEAKAGGGPTSRPSADTRRPT